MYVLQKAGLIQLANDFASMSQGSISKAPAQGATHVPHALTLRVMRLTPPLPIRTNAPPFIPHSSQSEAVPSTLSSPAWQAEGAPCGIGNLSVLPSSFGSIFASERFRSFISVYNRSADPLSDVSVTAYVQTASSRRIPLIDVSDHSKSLLQPRESINATISVCLPELGPHALVCTAIYTESRSGKGSTSNVHSLPPPRTLRQYFRFNVLPPVDVIPSVYSLYRLTDTVRLEPMIQHTLAAGLGPHYLVHVRVNNAISTAIYNTIATFKATPPFFARDLGATPEESTDEDLLRVRRATMGRGDSRNFIFLIRSNAGESKTAQSRRLRWTETGDRASTSDNRSGPANTEGRDVHRRDRELGLVVVKWRTALGEDGTVERKIKAASVVEESETVSVSIYAVPHEVKVHQPFVARCAARNNGKYPVRLYLQIRRDLVGEIVPVGVSGVGLGEVKAGETARCSITFLGLVRGQHSICGVRVVDMESNVSYKADTPLIVVG